MYDVILEFVRTNKEFQQNKEKINALVEKWRKEGLPKPASFKKGWAMISEEEKRLIIDIQDTAEQLQITLEEDCWETPPMPTPPDDDAMEILVNLNKKLLLLLQKSVLRGLMSLYFIRNCAMTYGIVPDSRFNWKFNCMMGAALCWKCNGNAAVHKSHEDEGDEKTIFYCNTCDGACDICDNASEGSPSLKDKTLH